MSYGCRSPSMVLQQEGQAQQRGEQISPEGHAPHKDPSCPVYVYLYMPFQTFCFSSALLHMTSRLQALTRILGHYEIWEYCQSTSNAQA